MLGKAVKLSMLCNEGVQQLDLTNMKCINILESRIPRQGKQGIDQISAVGKVVIRPDAEWISFNRDSWKEGDMVVSRKSIGHRINLSDDSEWTYVRWTELPAG